MAIDLSLIGLLVIAVAWLIQLVYVFKKSREIKKSFVLVYAIGVLLLVIQGYNNGDTNGLTLNLLSLVLAVLVLLSLAMKKRLGTTAVKKKKR